MTRPDRRFRPVHPARRRALAVGGGALAAALLAGLPRARAQGSFLDDVQDTLKQGTDALDDFGGDGDGDGGGGLSEGDIARGLKQALEVASRAAVSQVGKPGGYLNDAAVHIPLPDYLADIQSTLSRVGASGLLDAVERRLNRGAEAAAPEAERLFLDAIESMTLADARQILEGRNDAATRYFQRKMSPGLRRTFRPIVERELERAGAVAALDSVDDRLRQVPFAPALGGDAKSRLVRHGVDGALDGLFHYLAEEEAAIRKNPAKRTTDLLRRVFG